MTSARLNPKVRFTSLAPGPLNVDATLADDQFSLAEALPRTFAENKGRTMCGLCSNQQIPGFNQRSWRTGRALPGSAPVA